MKIFYLILFYFLFTTNNCLNCEGFAYNKKDCRYREFNDSYYKCCYTYLIYIIQETTKEKRQCNALTEDEYDNIGKYIEKLEKTVEEEGSSVYSISIDCGVEPEKDDPCSRKATNVSDCYNRISGDKYFKCCYFDLLFKIQGSTEEIQERKECNPLTKDEYNNIDDFIKNYKNEIKKGGGIINKLTINCPNEHSPCELASGTKLSDCEGIEPGSNYYTCCYFDVQYELEGNTTEIKKCEPITLDDYINLDLVIQKDKQSRESKGQKINKYILDCKGKSNESSNRLNISIILFISILLFL